jgi:hypothetical protein
MLERFRNWYLNYYAEITWFLIGFLFMGGLSSIGRGDYIDAALCWAIAVLNYIFIKR